MRCKKCGREISSKDLFCTGCGAKQTPKKKSHKGILILVVFVMLAIAVVGGIWCVKQLLSNTKHEQEREEVSSADGNLWEELDNDLDADEKEEKKEEEKENSDEEEEKEESSEEKSSEEKEAEPFERGRIDPAGEKYFFLTQSDVMEIFGEPDVEYEEEGDYAGKHIEYGEIGITFAEGE